MMRTSQLSRKLTARYLEKSAEQGNRHAEQLLYSVNHDIGTFMAINSLSLMRYAGSVIQNKTEENIDSDGAKKHTTDRKTAQKEREKKEAQGMHTSM